MKICIKKGPCYTLEWVVEFSRLGRGAFFKVSVLKKTEKLPGESLVGKIVFIIIK